MTDTVIPLSVINQALPDFSLFPPEKIQSTLSALIEASRKQREQVKDESNPNGQTVIAPLEEVDDSINNFWSIISHLNGVCNTQEWRSVYESCIPLLTAYSSEVGQDEDLYRLFLAIQKSDEFDGYSVEKKQSINNALKDFTLSGVALNVEDKAKYTELKQSLAELSNTFSNNVLDATAGWFFHAESEGELDGLPEANKISAKNLARQKELSGWVINLDIPSYLPAMENLRNRQLRKKLYQAYVTRASALSPQKMTDEGAPENEGVITEILKNKLSLAQLLGFASYADVSLEKKMAESPQEVERFLLGLGRKSLEQGKAEFAELKRFAKEKDGVDVEAWDLAFYSERLREEKYAISQDALRPWFPVDVVIKGMFSVVNKLFNIEVREEDGFSRWHDDVRLFHVFQQDEKIASFYLDLFAREGKRGGAWMAGCRVRRNKGDGSLQLPVAFLVCNFPPPSEEQPSLLTHNDVTTLFHEFGHGLHHMLTKVGVADVSGINGVAWDAVELPSQFLENWCWESEVIPLISSHYETQEPLPVDMLDKLLAAKNFQSAMQMLRQLEFALFDMRLHQSASLNTQDILNNVRKEIAVVPVPEFNRFQCGFSHIFAGGYAAGYYSYKWAEVLSADAYSLFEENGVFDLETGKSFLHNILQKGGSEAPEKLFADFRGRPPAVDPLLRHSGIRV